VIAGPETLPQLLVDKAARWGDTRVAMRRKEFGIWRRYTWGDYLDQVRALSLGLVALGLERGDRVAIVGENDPEWYWAEIGAQSAGGVAFGIFSDCTPPEILYYLEHSEAMCVFAHDQEQTDKVLSIAERLPALRRIVYWDPKGLWFYDHPRLMSFADLLAAGRRYETEHPGFFADSVAQGKAADVAVFCYTSGTTGKPKAAMLPHQVLIQSITAVGQVHALRETDEYVSFIPPAWSTEQYLGIAGQLVFGFTVNFPEEPETVREDLREIAPHVLVYTTRLWEAICSEIQAEMEDARGLKRLTYWVCRRVAERIVEREVRGEPLGIRERALRAATEWLCFRGVRDRLGLIRARHAITGGAPLGPENFKLVRTHGIKLKQLYGLTETGLLSTHPEAEVRPETLGRPLPGVEIKIADDGEILVKTRSMFAGYFKQPDGVGARWYGDWFRTGDGGMFDERGHLVYLDRVEEFRPLGGQRRFPPSYVETRLRFSPYVKDCCAVGGEDAPAVLALITIDFENVGRWADTRRLAYTTFSDLSQKPEVYDLIASVVQQLNRSMPGWMRIGAFALLPKELDPDEGELTRTRKLRRNFVEQRHGALIRAMFDGAADFAVETPVVYRDGRRAIVRTTIPIRRVAE
jgi:long-chain acyl-CoA synthetase